MIPVSSELLQRWPKMHQSSNSPKPLRLLLHVKLIICERLPSWRYLLHDISDEPGEAQCDRQQASKSGRIPIHFGKDENLLHYNIELGIPEMICNSYRGGHMPMRVFTVRGNEPRGI